MSSGQPNQVWKAGKGTWWQLMQLPSKSNSVFKSNPNINKRKGNVATQRKKVETDYHKKKQKIRIISVRRKKEWETEGRSWRSLAFNQTKSHHKSQTGVFALVGPNGASVFDETFFFQQLLASHSWSYTPSHLQEVLQPKQLQREQEAWW